MGKRVHNTKSAIFVSILLFFFAGFVFAEDSGIVTDEDALFGEADDEGSSVDLEDSLFGEADDEESGFVVEITSSSGLDTSLLTSESAEIGGRYNFGGQSSGTWNDPELFFENLTTPDVTSASVDLGATLYVDARPAEDFRVFGKATIGYPFTGEPGSREFDDVIQVTELFSDFNWNETLFFRGGKQTINWGVGYFFSPADLLNITRIDPEDPDAEREGPVSLKTQLPIGAHTAYLYLIANGIETWDDIGVAAKAELVFGPAEIGIGGIYQKSSAPSGMLTASIPLFDVDFFGEVVIRYGSDRTFVVDSDTSPFGVETAKYDDTVFLNATAGFSFIYAFDEVDSSVNLAGQYLYNGEGYTDPAILQDNQAGIGALLGAGDLAASDLISSGAHYAAGSGGWNGIFGSDFTLRGFWIHNFSDMSGYLSPTLSYTPFDGMSLSLGTPYQYGDPGDEYTPFGDALSVQIGVSLGGGSF